MGSALHLKQELNRAARLLKDPGTCSSWKHQKLSSNVKFDNADKEKRVLLRNWNELANVDHSASARNSYASSSLFKCKEACFAPSIRRKRPKKKIRSRFKIRRNPVRDRRSSPFHSGFEKHDDDDDDEDEAVSLSSAAISMSSYDRRKRFLNPPSFVDSSWEAAATDDDDDRLHLGRRHVCGIPCCWSKDSTPKSMIRYGIRSTPPLSDAFSAEIQTSAPLLRRRKRRESSSFSTEHDFESSNRFEGLNSTSLSRKYQPIFFDEVIGQNTVVQSLVAAVSSKRIDPFYLFAGPRGTGKTSAARIFAAALNCLAPEGIKPCGVCGKCDRFVSGQAGYLTELNGSDTINRIRKTAAAAAAFKVFAVKECHLLPSKAWLSFLRLQEKHGAVFVFIAGDADNVPETILSRCRKLVFNRIDSDEILSRLAKISADENFDIDAEALDLIVSNADGSLKDAETILEQLSLLGKRITIPLVNDLMGVVSDEKLLELLEIAMSSNAMETVIRSRELLDSGIDPTVLISQMASLIVDIIAASHRCAAEESSSTDPLSLSEEELNRLNLALSLLSDSEKHIRISSERSTWFTATLLQLGCLPGTSESSRRKLLTSLTSKDKSSRFECVNSELLNQIWEQCIEKCHSRTLRQLLREHGRLASISDVQGGLVAHVAFRDRNLKIRAECYLSSITSSMESVLRRNIEAKIILLPEPKIPLQRESIKSSPVAAATIRPERNQVLPQNSENSLVNGENPHQQWEDELNREMKTLRIRDGRNANTVSPSLLHNTSFETNFSIGYESGPAAGCAGLFCWNNNRRLQRRIKGKQAQVGLREKGRISCFGNCCKTRET